jgi:hypothetical protein
MPGTSEPLVLWTSFGSQVIAAGEGDVRHGFAGPDDLGLLFLRSGDEVWPHREASSAAALAAFDGRFTAPWRVEEQPRAPYVALRTAEEVLSAQPGGTLTATRNSVNTWEMFELVPLSDARRRFAPASPAIPRFGRAAAITPVVHQTFKDTRLPLFLQENVERLQQRMGRGYSYRLWTDQDCLDFIYGHYGFDVLTSYLRIDPRYGACRADLFRYLCVYKLGGVYLDIKSAITRPLDEIIEPDDVYLLIQWDNAPDGRWPLFGLHPDLSDIAGGEYQQWHIAAAAGHPFLERVIETVLRNIHDYSPERTGSGKMGVLRLSGPIAYTRAIHPIRHLHPHRMVEPEQDGLQYNAVSGFHHAQPAHYSKLEVPIVC